MVVSRARELEIAQYGITLEQAGVLHTIHEKGGSTTNAEIANRMIRQYNSVTTLVNRMMKLGLVNIEKSPVDKKFKISMTTKGQDIYERITTNSIRMAFSDLSLDDKKNLSSYLQHVVDKSRDLIGMDKKLPFLN